MPPEGKQIRSLCCHAEKAAPSTAHQIQLDLRPGARLHFRMEPAGYQLHLWQEGSGLVTHTAVFGDWSGR